MPARRGNWSPTRQSQCPSHQPPELGTVLYRIRSRAPPNKRRCTPISTGVEAGHCRIYPNTAASPRRPSCNRIIAPTRRSRRGAGAPQAVAYHVRHAQGTQSLDVGASPLGIILHRSGGLLLGAGCSLATCDGPDNWARWPMWSRPARQREVHAGHGESPATTAGHPCVRSAAIPQQSRFMAGRESSRAR